MGETWPSRNFKQWSKLRDNNRSHADFFSSFTADFDLSLGFESLALDSVFFFVVSLSVRLFFSLSAAFL